MPFLWCVRELLHVVKYYDPYRFVIFEKALIFNLNDDMREWAFFNVCYSSYMTTLSICFESNVFFYFLFFPIWLWGLCFCICRWWSLSITWPVSLPSSTSFNYVWCFIPRPCFPLCLSLYVRIFAGRRRCLGVPKWGTLSVDNLGGEKSIKIIKPLQWVEIDNSPFNENYDLYEIKSANQEDLFILIMSRRGGCDTRKSEMKEINALLYSISESGCRVCAIFEIDFAFL